MQMRREEIHSGTFEVQMRFVEVVREQRQGEKYWGSVLISPQQKGPNGWSSGFTQSGNDFFETPAWGTFPANWRNVRLVPKLRLGTFRLGIFS